MKKTLVYLELNSFDTNVVQDLIYTFTDKPFSVCLVHNNDQLTPQADKAKASLGQLTEQCKFTVLDTIPAASLAEHAQTSVGEFDLLVYLGADEQRCASQKAILHEQHGTSKAVLSLLHVQKQYYSPFALFVLVHEWFFSELCGKNEETTKFIQHSLGVLTNPQLGDEPKKQLKNLILAFVSELARPNKTNDYLHKIVLSMLSSDSSLFQAGSLALSAVHVSQPKDKFRAMKEIYKAWRDSDRGLKNWSNLERVFDGLKDNSTETTLKTNLKCLLSLQLYLNDTQNEAHFAQLCQDILLCAQDDKLTHALLPLMLALCKEVKLKGADFPTSVIISPENEKPPVALPGVLLGVLFTHLRGIYQSIEDAQTLTYLKRLYANAEQAQQGEEQVLCLRVLAQIYPRLSQQNKPGFSSVSDTTVALANALFEHNSPFSRGMAKLIAEQECLLRLRGCSDLRPEELKQGIDLSESILKAHAQDRPEWADKIEQVLSDVVTLRKTEKPEAIFDFINTCALYLNDPHSETRKQAFDEARQRASGHPSKAWQRLGASLAALSLLITASVAAAIYAPPVLLAGAGMLVLYIKAHLAAESALATFSLFSAAGSYLKAQEKGVSKDLHELGAKVNASLLKSS